MEGIRQAKENNYRKEVINQSGVGVTDAPATVIREGDMIKPDCRGCANTTNNTCDFPDTCVNLTRAVGSNHISAMVEWAEERHLDRGHEVICDHAEECVNKKCTFQIPYKHFSLEPTQWRCKMDEETQCKCIAYRGNPEEPAKEKDGE